ncbi:MAG: alpha/beta hydrolase [Bacteroidales bacterium]|nr:alpha/beta hydrolase [Bacteroidales bacterium]
MKRLIFAILVSFSLTAPAQTASSAADASLPLRTFQQPDGYKGSSIPYGDNAAAGHYVQADDARIYYEVYGQGDPVVVLHGGGVGCTYEMGEFIDSLQKTNLVIAVSTRGHGKSEIGHVKISHEQRANDVLAVMDAVIPGRSAAVIGFSDGAYSAYKLAAMYPSRVERLVAIGAGENVPQLRKIVPSKVDEMLQLDPLFMKKQLSLMPEPERLQDYWNDFYEFYNQLVVSKALLGSIQCPVLVMAGELDPNAPLATVIAAYQMIPHSQLAIIANAGHPAFVANFPAVWANVKPFLAAETI